MSFVSNKLLSRSVSSVAPPTTPTWNTTTLPAANANRWVVAYGEGRFVAVSGASYGSQTAAYSDDGITWTQTLMPSSSNWISIAYGNGRFIATTNSTPAAYSDDGANWTAFDMPLSNSWLVTYGDNKFVAIGVNYHYSYRCCY